MPYLGYCGDLANAFGSDYRTAMDHWLKQGCRTMAGAAHASSMFGSILLTPTLRLRLDRTTGRRWITGSIKDCRTSTGEARSSSGILLSRPCRHFLRAMVVPGSLLLCYPTTRTVRTPWGSVILRRQRMA